MDQRQKDLLYNITSHYIKTASPVSSKFITESSDFNLSSATIRNEMAELEKAGYIFQPHTSAGRIPTEKGYCFYVDNFLADILPAKRDREKLEKIAENFSPESVRRITKDLAKSVSELSDGAVFVAFADNDFYYTGISNLFGHPEFQEQQLVYSLSRIIDHFDTVINKIFDSITGEVTVAIGSQNPFGNICSSVVTQLNFSGAPGVFGVLGPLRMDYQNNFSLVKYTRQLINKL